ncbi:MAG: MFS transporter [Sphingomonadales bacterium]|nr:MFS transporter [Sphingomonadales bacterium]
MSLAEPVARPTRWGQVALAALSQNVATGLTFGSFGTLVLAIEREYHADRSQSSLALSLAVVTLTVTAMLIGRRIDRINLRLVMMAGAALCCAGFALVSVVNSPAALLATYALLIGPGTAMAGVLPSMTLATRWVPETLRGRALGLVNMPIAVMIVPLAIAPVLLADGPRTVYLLLAAAAAALIPVLLLVRDGLDGPVAPTVAPDQTGVPAAITILRRPAFWVLVVAIGFVTGAGTMKLAHFIPLLTGQGRSFDEANTLLALQGGSGIFGSLLFGWLADRIGGPRALAINAGIQAVVWTIYLAPVSLPVLTIDAVIGGACGGGVAGAFGVTVAALFGARAFGRTYSLFQISTLPFLFAMTPLASALFQATGSYHLPMGLTVGCLAFAAVLLFALSGKTAREPLHQAPA